MPHTHCRGSCHEADPHRADEIRLEACAGSSATPPSIEEAGPVGYHRRDRAGTSGPRRPDLAGRRYGYRHVRDRARRRDHRRGVLRERSRLPARHRLRSEGHRRTSHRDRRGQGSLGARRSRQRPPGGGMGAWGAFGSRDHHLAISSRCRAASTPTSKPWQRPGRCGSTTTTSTTSSGWCSRRWPATTSRPFRTDGCSIRSARRAAGRCEGWSAWGSGIPMATV